METLRKITQNKVFKIVFALFLIVPFGLFGVEQYLSAPVGGDTVVNVGGSKIGRVELDQAIRQETERLRAQFGASFDASIMENPEIRRGILERLVNDRLISIGAVRSAVTVPDRQLAERITSEEAFQVDGRFSKERYEQVAKSLGLTPVGLDERLRTDFREQRFRESITATAIVPKTTLDNFIRLSEQQREVSVVNFTPNDYMAKVKVTPEQVKAHYEQNPKEFTVPERVRVEYIELSVDTLAALVQVSPEDIRRAYDDGMQRNQWGSAEERKASHILVSVTPEAPEADQKAAEAKAKAIAEQVRKNPKSFADVAKKESQDPGSAPQGGDLGFFPRGAMVKAFEDAAFGAQKGEIVGPVKSEFGWHVIQVTDVKPAKVKSLAEATPEIEGTLKKQAAQARFAEAAEVFTNIVYEQPTSLQPAAQNLALPIQQSPWISQGMVPVPVLSNQKLQAEIFSSNTIQARRNTTAVEVSPGTLVAARVIEHEPAKLRPFEEVRAEIEKRLQRDEAMKLARAEGEAKLKDAQAGKDADIKWPAPLAVNRQKPGGLFPVVIERAFRPDPRKLPAIVGVETPMGYSLVKVTRAIEPEAIDPAQRKTLGTQLERAVSLSELDSTLDSLRQEVGVKVSQTALEPPKP